MKVERTRKEKRRAGPAVGKAVGSAGRRHTSGDKECRPASPGRPPRRSGKAQEEA
jgi:hypothetical protein